MIPIYERLRTLEDDLADERAALERANGAIAGYQTANTELRQQKEELARALQEVTDNYNELVAVWEKPFLVLDGDTEKLVQAHD